MDNKINKEASIKLFGEFLESELKLHSGIMVDSKDWYTSVQHDIIKEACKRYNINFHESNTKFIFTNQDFKRKIEIVNEGKDIKVTIDKLDVNKYLEIKEEIAYDGVWVGELTKEELEALESDIDKFKWIVVHFQGLVSIFANESVAGETLSNRAAIRILEGDINGE